MAKLDCPCGNTLSNSESPNRTAGVLLNDLDLKFDDKKTCVDIKDIGRSVRECEKCGRLAFSYPKKHASTVKWFLPEDGTPPGFMQFGLGYFS